MNLLVCIRQGLSGDSSQPIDLLARYALEAAALLQDEDPEAQITLLSLGGKEALLEAWSIAGDRMLLLEDEAFRGSDQQGKGRILAAAVRLLEQQQGAPFDLIFCGQQSADEGSGLVGPALAHQLGRSFVSAVIRAERDGEVFRLEQECKNGVRILEAQAPCVALVTRSDLDLRYPTIFRKMQANDMEDTLTPLGLANLPGLNADEIGGKAACVQRQHLFAPQKKSGQVRLRAATGAAAAVGILSLLEQEKIV